MHAGLSAGALTAYSHEWHLLCTFLINALIHLPPFAVLPSVSLSLLTLSVGFQGRSVESLSWLLRSSVTAGSVHTQKHSPNVAQMLSARAFVISAGCVVVADCILLLPHTETKPNTAMHMQALRETIMKYDGEKMPSSPMTNCWYFVSQTFFHTFPNAFKINCQPASLWHSRTLTQTSQSGTSRSYYLFFLHVCTPGTNIWTGLSQFCLPSLHWEVLLLTRSKCCQWQAYFSHDAFSQEKLSQKSHYLPVSLSFLPSLFPPNPLKSRKTGLLISHSYIWISHRHPLIRYILL